MENTVVSNVILDKKMDDYRQNMNNFVAPQELTVTITLAEYRELVGRSATAQADIDAANKDKWSRDKENEKLKEEVSKLKAEIYELTKADLCEFVKADEEDD